MLKRLDRYVLFESLPAFVFSVLIYSSLSIISMSVPRLQWIIGTPLLELGIWLLWQYPVAISQTVAIALLLAVLLAFGRYVSDHEVLAMQAGGVSLPRFVWPLLLLSLLSTLGALALNEWVLPHTNARVGDLWWRMTSADGRSGIWRLINKNISLSIGSGEDKRPVGFYFAGADDKTREMFDVRVDWWDGKELTVLFAEKAALVDYDMHLTDYRVYKLDLGADVDLQVDTTLPTELPLEAQLEHLKIQLSQALSEARAVLRVFGRSTAQGATLVYQTSKTLEDLIVQYSDGAFEPTLSISGAYTLAHNPDIPPIEQREAAITFHRKLAEPFASLVLLLIALPLAASYARSRSVAFGLSLIVTMVWYLLMTFGEIIARGGVVPIWLGLWGGNTILGMLGGMLGALYWREHRAG